MEASYSRLRPVATTKAQLREPCRPIRRPRYQVLRFIPKPNPWKPVDLHPVDDHTAGPRNMDQPSGVREYRRFRGARTSLLPLSGFCTVCRKLTRTSICRASAGFCSTVPYLLGQLSTESELLQLAEGENTPRTEDSPSVPGRPVSICAIYRSCRKPSLLRAGIVRLDEALSGRIQQVAGLRNGNSQVRCWHKSSGKTKLRSPQPDRWRRVRAST